MNAPATPRKYLITGGSSGIGRACAKFLTAEGAKVWITGTRDATVGEAIDSGDAIGGSVCDIVDRNSVDRTFANAAGQLGGLDGTFLNAGIDGGGKAAEIDPVQFRHVLDVNVLGTFHCAQAAYRHLGRPGVIVVNASVNALRPEVHFADYNSSKAAVASLAQSLAIEWSAERLSVVAVSPGYFPSNMTAPYMNDPTVRAELLARIPAGRFGEPEEIGATVSFLLSGSAPYLAGANITIAGASNV